MFDWAIPAVLYITLGIMFDLLYDAMIIESEQDDLEMIQVYSVRYIEI